MEENSEPKQATDNVDALSRFAPHIADLRRSVRELGANKVSNLLADVLLEFFTSDVADTLPPEISSVLGETAVRQIQDSRSRLQEFPELKEDFALQLGQIGKHWLLKAERGRRILGQVRSDSRGRLQVDLGSLMMPIERLSRIYDWGGCPDAEDELAHIILDLARFEYLSREFGKAISAMRHIAKSNAYQTLGPDMDIAGWIETGDGLSLELFLRDCIERAGFGCARAPLNEDLLEATDLRVTLPKLDRNRGVRVQVSWISEFALFKRKRFLIPHASTVVFLSPFTLAQRWRWEHDDMELLSTEGLSTYDHLPEDEAAARGIQASFAGAVNQKPYPILGPAVNAPEELVRLIGNFVEKEGRRCHARLRSKQEQRPAYGSRAENVRDRMIMRMRLRNEVIATPQSNQEREP